MRGFAVVGVWGKDEKTDSIQLGDATTTQADAADSRTGSGEIAYLLVFEGDSSSMFELPRTGQTIIGRAENSDLRLRETSVSRAHAQITTMGGHATISDLGSHNGTLVNGERIAGARALVSGDVISLCAVNLVFHTRARAPMRRSPLDFEQLCQHIADEVDRALRYHRTLAVLAIAFGGRGPDRARVVEVLFDHIRRIDLIGWASSDQAIVVMPETDAPGADATAHRLLAALELHPESAPLPRVGVVTCPSNGCDVGTLLAGARAACSAASAGEVSQPGAGAQTMRIADRTIVVADPAMRALYSLIERLAKADLPVLIHGETGTGKELAAKALHAWSARKDRPLIAINCASLPESLAESELFGYLKGAFSGADQTKAGLLEAAMGGTVFFDEIGELPLAVQAKLLRALETKRAMRIGDVSEHAIDFRIVAATNRRLGEEVGSGRFRQDLFFRLSGATLWLPPLRDRKQELPILAHRLLKEACERASRSEMTISDESMRLLATYTWPGNIRELKNVIDYVVAAYPEPVVMPWHFSNLLGASEAGLEYALQTIGAPGGGVRVEPMTESPPETAPPFRPIEEEIRDLEKNRMRAALQFARGNQTRAAELIQMPLRTFVTKLKAYGLREEFPKGRGAEPKHDER